MPVISLPFPSVAVGLARLKERLTRVLDYIELALQVRRERRFLLGLS
jgi:hypothetical protein